MSIRGSVALFWRFNAVYVVPQLYNIYKIVQQTCNDECNLKLRFCSFSIALLYGIYSLSLHIAVTVQYLQDCTAQL
jgi:hypothetical protein